MKFWTVIWSDTGRTKFEVKEKDAIIMLDEKHGIEFNANKIKRGRPKIRVADVYPLFPTEIEAEAYRRGNRDFLVVTCTVSIHR